jgi:hypothetical protein
LRWRPVPARRGFAGALADEASILDFKEAGANILSMNTQGAAYRRLLRAGSLLAGI